MGVVLHRHNLHLLLPITAMIFHRVVLVLVRLSKIIMVQAIQILLALEVLFKVGLSRVVSPKTHLQGKVRLHKQPPS